MYFARPLSYEELKFFAGCTPLEVIEKGNIVELFEVNKYLDAMTTKYLSTEQLYYFVGKVFKFLLLKVSGSLKRYSTLSGKYKPLTVDVNLYPKYSKTLSKSGRRS